MRRLRAAPGLPGGRTPGSLRGFSLLEVIVVAVVASVLFMVLIRWVLTLGSVTGVSLENSAAARNASYTEGRLTTDFGQATICDQAAGNPIRQLTDKTLELYANVPQSDGTVATSIVRWRVDGGVITRTDFRVDPDSPSGCEPIVAGAVERVVGLNAVNRAAFTAYRVGAPTTDCEARFEQGVTTSTGDGCFADAVGVDITYLAVGSQPAPALVKRVYPLTISYGAGR